MPRDGSRPSPTSPETWGAGGRPRTGPSGPMDAKEITHRLSTVWNTSDPEERRRILREICVVDAEFLSPHGANHGVEEHARGIDLFRKSFPKSKVVHGTADLHHQRLRFPWTTQWNDGRPPT